MGTPAGFCSNEGMFQAFALVWQTAQNGRLHKTGGTYYQSCMYPTDSAWPAFLMPFLLHLPVDLATTPRFFNLLCPQQNRAYSALHPQALTECSPLDFRRSSIKKEKKKMAHIKDITVTSKAFKMIIINRHTGLKTNLEL